MARTLNTPGTKVASYVLDEDKAQAWIDSIISAYDGDGEEVNEDSPQFGSAWEPRTYGEESTIDQLVYAANHVEGILSGPAGSLYFNFEGDDDGGYCRFLVDIEFTVAGFSETMRLATMGSEMRKLGDRDTTGREAALSILRDAVGGANFMIKRLNLLAGHQV